MIFTCHSCKTNITNNVYMAFDYSFCSSDCRNNYYKINYINKNFIKKSNSIRNLTLPTVNINNQHVIKNNNEIIKNNNNYINESKNKKIINYIKNRIFSREIFSIFNILLW